MAIEATSALIGGLLGLMGGVSGVVLGHILSSTREAKSRRIEGLKQVMTELNRLSRLGLVFDQFINVGLQAQSADEFARGVFELDGWKEATHELQEQAWKFVCMAYLPAAYGEFEEIDQLIGTIMDPHSEKPESGRKSRAAAVQELVMLQAKIQIKVQERLTGLV